MDLRLLGYVVAIAEEGSISGAARRLQLTQPTLSRQLRELERRLGVDVFARVGAASFPPPPGRHWSSGPCTCWPTPKPL
ncbi:LysR family transcriptional regulator [Nonomuraea sp. CA-141351]|uniref:LysR family transcriptional regulator n=1 Tax=Nonomuraea sp. CA-141351 TaxID=3239996 RepID=UPI003D8EBA03